MHHHSRPGNPGLDLGEQGAALLGAVTVGHEGLVQGGLESGELTLNARALVLGIRPRQVP